MTVVFDGYAVLKLDWNALRREGIKIVFSDDESADDRIVRMVEETAHPKEILVVTSDRELSSRIRKVGAKTALVKTFMYGKTGKRAETIVAPIEEKKQLDSEQARKITQELERIWLKKT